MKPSKYQQAIYDWVKHGKGSAVITATAGSDKTTTIVEAAKLIPPSKSVCFVAFNKSIAGELQKRVPSHVKAATLNSLGYGAWIKFVGHAVKVDGQKTWQVMDEVVSKDERRVYGATIKKLTGLAKAHGLVPKGCIGLMSLTFDTEQAWTDLVGNYGVEPERGGTVPRLIELSRLVLQKSIDLGRSVVDFDDQIYLPVIHEARFWPYDVLFCDELQDVNLIQRAMLKVSLKPGGRFIGVGDKFQSCYGFRGADTNSVDNTKKEFSAIELPLSVSYRCPRAVVREAQRFVSHIEPSETAPEGKVETLTSWTVESFVATDGVVCRNTAPLVDLAYRFIRRHKGCRILGREIGQGLITLIKKMDAETVDDLERRLDTYLQRETAKLMAKGQEDKAGGLSDKVETIQILIAGLPETNRTLDRLYEQINTLFTDNNTGLLTLSTVHKAKGLEWDRVFILEPKLMPSKWARQQWMQQQERNLQYVAVTRAKSELYYIELEKFREKPEPVASTPAPQEAKVS